MIEKYIIGKEDLPKLIRGEELSLSQGSKARAFKIEIIGNLTNGDMIMAMFSNAWKSDFIDIANHSTLYVDDKHELEVDIDWWNAPYEGGKEE